MRDTGVAALGGDLEAQLGPGLLDGRRRWPSDDQIAVVALRLGRPRRDDLEQAARHDRGLWFSR